jgi:hypothetical protein
MSNISGITTLIKYGLSVMAILTIMGCSETEFKDAQEASTEEPPIVDPGPETHSLDSLALPGQAQACPVNASAISFGHL